MKIDQIRKYVLLFHPTHFDGYQAETVRFAINILNEVWIFTNRVYNEENTSTEVWSWESYRTETE